MTNQKQKPFVLPFCKRKLVFTGLNYRNYQLLENQLLIQRHLLPWHRSPLPSPCPRFSTNDGSLVKAQKERFLLLRNKMHSQGRPHVFMATKE